MTRQRGFGKERNVSGYGNWLAVRRFLSDDSGAAATEYAVLLALILIVAIAGIQIHGTWLFDTYTNMNSEMFGG